MKCWDEYLDFAQGGRQLVNKVDDAFVVVNVHIRRLLMEVKKQKCCLSWLVVSWIIWSTGVKHLFRRC